MKASVLLMSGLIIAFVHYSRAFGKDPTNVNTNSDTMDVKHIALPEPVPKKDDIVTNLEMINNFQRSYDRIEVVPWEDLLSSIPASDWGIAYTAYRQLSFKTPADSSATFIQSLALEMSMVREDMKNIPDSICKITNPNFKNVKPRRIVIIKNKE